MIYIGIDTGVNTGVAVWDSDKKKFIEIQTLMIHQAMHLVGRWWTICKVNAKGVKVVFEDARLRKWYGFDASKKMQGAGAVKRDAKIWEDFLTDLGIPFVTKHPLKGMTKLDADPFKRLTGWNGRTSHHSRDAAMLVFGAC